MIKDTFYFSHDYNSRQDEKIAFYLSKTGLEGYGVYWLLIELMHQTNDGKLTIAFIEGIAYNERVDISVLKKCYNVAIDCGLFVCDDVKFWSERVIRNKENLNSYREKKSIAGKKGMEKRWGKNNSDITEDNTTITNDNKGKESKVNKIKVNKSIEKKTKNIFLPPSLPEVIEYFKENGFPEVLAKRAFNHYAVADWYDTKGEPVRNWKQKMQSVWFKEENRLVNVVQTPEPIGKRYREL